MSKFDDFRRAKALELLPISRPLLHLVRQQIPLIKVVERTHGSPEIMHHYRVLADLEAALANLLTEYCADEDA